MAGGKLFKLTAQLWARRPAGLVLTAYALGTDCLISWHGLNFTLRGLIDEPAHIATALVVLGAIIRFRRSPPPPVFGWTMLLCSVLVDLDHLPAEFGSYALTNGTPRPYTHALWTVIVLTLAWAFTRALSLRTRLTRRTRAELILAGAASGVAVHFLRDIATAPMSLWWPLSDMPVQAPYWWYVVILVLTVILGPVSRGGTLRLSKVAWHKIP